MIKMVGESSPLRGMSGGLLGLSLAGTTLCGLPAQAQPDLPQPLALQPTAEPTVIPDSTLPVASLQLAAVAPPESSPVSYRASDLSAQRGAMTVAQTPRAVDRAREVELNPKILEGSPLLQRWLDQVPDVLSDLESEPSFRTRFRLGYSQFPSTNQTGGVNLGIEDVFIGRTGLTLSADYQTTLSAGIRRNAWGTDLHYYLAPLGGYVNIAPVVGYRSLETPAYKTDGVNIGVRLLLVLSRGGGADLSLTQTWVSPGSLDEVGITTLSTGYALTHNLRISADIQQQNARQGQDSRVGIGLEWML